MYGYIFETKNIATGKTSIGKRYSVKFDKNFFGVDDAEIKKYGKEAFTVRMIRAFEDQETLDYVFDEMMQVEVPAETAKPRKKRAKAVEE